MFTTSNMKKISFKIFTDPSKHGPGFSQIYPFTYVRGKFVKNIIKSTCMLFLGVSRAGGQFV